MRVPLLLVFSSSMLILGGCHLLGSEPADCDSDLNCPTGQRCDLDNTCVAGDPPGGEGEGEGEAVGGGEGEGEAVGEGEGEAVGEGEGEAVGEGEGEGDVDAPCVIGGACQPRVIARNLVEPRGIALVDGRIFVTVGGVTAAGCVKEVIGLAGATADIACETGGSNVRPIQVVATATHLYWVNDDAVTTASVRRMALDGTGKTTVATVDRASSTPVERAILASNGVTASWLDQASTNNLNVFTDVVGGTPTVHKSADSFPKALSVTATELVFGNNTSGVSHIAFDAPATEVPTVLTGSSAALLASVVTDAVRAFAFADLTVSVGDVGLVSVPSDSVGGDGNAAFAAADAAHVWWATDGQICRLYRADADANVEMVFEGIGVCGGLAVDDDFVYLTDLDANANDRGIVMRLRKPL